MTKTPEAQARHERMNLARQGAMRELARRHPQEFGELFAEAKKALGVADCARRPCERCGADIRKASPGRWPALCAGCKADGKSGKADGKSGKAPPAGRRKAAVLTTAAVAAIIATAAGCKSSTVTRVTPLPSPVVTCVAVHAMMAQVQSDLHHAAGDDPVPPGTPAGTSPALYWDARALGLAREMQDSPLPPCDDGK